MGRHPIRKGALGRLPRPRGVVVAVASFVAVATFAWVSTIHAEKPIFGTGLPGATSTLTGPMQPGQRRVVFFGDSVAYNLSRDVPHAVVPNLSVGQAVQLGCGVVYPFRFQGKGDDIAYEATQCTGYDRRWQALIDTVHPDLAVIVSGSAELFDVNIDGTPVRSGTPAYDALMEKAFNHAVDVAGSNGARPVLVANVPCFQRRFEVTPEAAKFLGFPPEFIPDVEAMQNDPVRQKRLNAVLDKVKAAHPNVQLLDFRSYLCPKDTYVDTLDGVLMRYDGAHFSPEGTAKWWEHFAPQIQATLPKDAVPRPSGIPNF